MQISESETKFFYELTPERVLEAVEQIGVRCTGRCLALNSMENRVFEVEIEVDEEAIESPHERFRVVKFYRPGRWSEEQLKEEHQFLSDLVKAEIPVAAPILFDNNETIKFLPDIGVWYTVFPKVAGRNLDELDDEKLERIGRLLARLHSVGAAKESPSRIALDIETYGKANLELLLSSEHLPVEIREQYSALVNTICEFSAPKFEGVPIQRVHGDCHVGNILWGSAGCFLVDFDDMVRGPCVQDIWLVVPGRDEFALRQREILLTAYESMKSFDRMTLGLVEPLRALRIIHFSAWIAKRWSDPAFQRTFPDFGSNQYWREQLIALDEQVRIVRDGIFPQT